MGKREAEKHMKDNLSDKDYRRVLAVNELTVNPQLYGSLGYGIGDSKYNDALTSEKIMKFRREQTESEAKSGRQLGVAGRPPFLDEFRTSRYIHQILFESVQGVPLTNLEGIVKDVSGQKIEIPNGLATKAKEVIKKGESGQKLSKDEEKILEIMGTYRMAAWEYMRRGSALGLMNEHAYDPLKANLEELKEEYQKLTNPQNPTSP